MIQTAANAAKARIGEAIPLAPAGPEPLAVFDVPAPFQPRPAVDFFADGPIFDDVVSPPEALPDGAIAFDDGVSMNGVDDEGIPVWEDAP